jgi:hypothetical protein
VLFRRAQQLPALLSSELGESTAASAALGRVLQHPFQASLLNKSSRELQRHMRVLSQR